MISIEVRATNFGAGGLKLSEFLRSFQLFIDITSMGKRQWCRSSNKFTNDLLIGEFIVELFE
jgi:hypothetical protein